MSKITFNIKEVNSYNDLDDLTLEFTKKMMDALEIGTIQDEKVLQDIQSINKRLAIDDMEIKQKSDYYNTWRMYSSYQKYMRGCKEYDSIKKWYNGNLTKPQLDKAMEVIAAFKESFIDTIDKIQNERLKNDLIATYEDISQVFTIKGLNPDEIENYIKAPNKDELVDGLIEKSNYRIENIQTQKNEIDVMDAMYQKIKTGFKSNLKELTERENNYLANLDLGLYKDGKDQKPNHSLNLDYIKAKYGSKAYKLIDKGIGAQFNKKKLAAALPAMKEFFNYKITGLGNNENFYSSNTQYGAIKTQIEGHLRIKGLTSADVSYVKKNNVSADDIIGKVKVNRTVECINNKVNDVSTQVNKKDVKSTLKAVHKGLKLLKDIQKGKLGSIARKDYDEIAKNVLGNANTFINLTSINEEARRSLNWFNRRTLRSVKEMKHELSLQLNQNEKIGPDSKVINNEIRQSIEIAIENDITKATTLINDHTQNKEATKEDIQNTEIIEDQVISN